MTHFYNTIIVLSFIYILYRFFLVIFSINRKDSQSVVGGKKSIIKPIQIKAFNYLLQVWHVKVLLLCTSLAASGSFLFMQEQLFLLSLLPEDGFFMAYYSTFWFSHMDVFPGVNSYIPSKYPTIKDHFMYIYFQKSMNKFYSFILIGTFFFFSVLHCLAGLISLLYDYFLKRIFLKNNYILTFFLLLIIQSFLKIFFLFSFLCFF